MGMTKMQIVEDAISSFPIGEEFTVLDIYDHIRRTGGRRDILTMREIMLRMGRLSYLSSRREKRSDVTTYRRIA